MYSLANKENEFVKCWNHPEVLMYISIFYILFPLPPLGAEVIMLLQMFVCESICLCIAKVCE